MNAYEFRIWKSVKHNDKFSHNLERTQLIHARNETEATNKITLEKGNTHKLQNLIITVSDEYIYSTIKIGTVTIKPFYVYSDGRTPRLVNKR